MVYKYKGIDKDGKRVSSSIEASSVKEAKAKLKAKAVNYQYIKESSPALFDRLQFGTRYKIPAKELANLSRELSMYIKSGIGIVSALKIVQSHYEHNKKMKLFINSVSTYLDEGKNFYTALISQKIAVLPEFYTASIQVSENGGILDEVLIELSRFLKEQERLGKEIKGAVAYPAFMIAVSLVMISFMLTFVVPKITSIFASTKQQLPSSTQFVIATGHFFSSHYQSLLIVVFLTIFSFAVLMRKNARFAYSVDMLILKTPLFGKITQKNDLGRFAYMAGLLVRSGVPFVQTINLGTNILKNRVLKKLFYASSKQVVEGKLLSSALNGSKIKIDHAFIQAVALGEETSQIQNVLTNISELYFEENKDLINTLLSLLEPALMLFVGGVIGFIVTAMLLPIFSMGVGK